MKKLQAALMALMLSASVKEGARSHAQSTSEDLLPGAGRLEMQGDLAAIESGQFRPYGLSFTELRVLSGSSYQISFLPPTAWP
jgi:hypothetical protein